MKKEGYDYMGKRNKQHAQNRYVSSKEIKATKLFSEKPETIHEFSEELSDGGERNEIITRQQKDNS